MSENIEQQSAQGSGLTRAAIIKMLIKNFEKLPDTDQKVFTYGSLYLAGNAGLAGLIANSFYRRALNVRQARVSTLIPMAMLPFVGTWGLYSASVSTPLMSADLHCPSCCVLRGALVGVVCGGVYPILLALPVNTGLAALYKTAPVPEKGNLVRFCMDVSRPVLRKIWPVIVLQAVFGSCLASKHFEIYSRLVQIAFGPEEERHEFD